MPRKPYPSDLTDAEWAILAPLIPAPKPGGRPPHHDRRDLVNAMRYVLRGGIAWQAMPHEYPPGIRSITIFGSGSATEPGSRPTRRCGRNSGSARDDQLRPPLPSWIASRSGRRKKGGVRGYDGAKKLSGRKRHLLVDTSGLVLRAVVHPANVADRDGCWPRCQPPFPMSIRYGSMQAIAVP